MVETDLGKSSQKPAGDGWAYVAAVSGGTESMSNWSLELERG